LMYTGEQASLVVFDQIWPHDSVTWCLDYPVLNFSVNTGIKGYPCDYTDVIGLTSNPVDDELYNKHLSIYNSNCFFGLTGRAFLFEPTSVIMFYNKRIHCTSKFVGEKLGLSLRFKVI
jgi:hypothetical protein